VNLYPMRNKVSTASFLCRVTPHQLRFKIFWDKHCPILHYFFRGPSQGSKTEGAKGLKHLQAMFQVNFRHLCYINASIFTSVV
jgi:hypothetical protein